MLSPIERLGQSLSKLIDRFAFFFDFRAFQFGGSCLSAEGQQPWLTETLLRFSSDA